ncbi:DUF7683 domain-containing protein [Rhodococcus sp. OK302]|uniref:DUF7683 domain-containing protein n=1 Tax=Rhodococcus sp. OK302 TaxID=1882769 RepID=UPI000B942E50|nr:hypothetical protein [Rhodococcus sp. OK302]OYD69710.1 hypothetical protein BDB13_3284 [Rhodococcus sp. OK302]
MWYLEAYDNDTELIVEDHLLHDMTVEIVKEILGIDDNDRELPISASKSGVPFDKVLDFEKYIREPIKVIPNCEYEIGFFAD